MDQSRLQLHLGQAIDSQTQGQDQQAAAELERVLDIGLTQPPVYFDLGLLLAGSDPAKALRHLSESVKHPDYDLASCLLMGQIHQKQEHWAEAAVAYIQALKLADLETVPVDQREELEQLYEAYLINQSEMEEATLQEYCRTLPRNCCAMTGDPSCAQPGSRQPPVNWQMRSFPWQKSCWNRATARWWNPWQSSAN